MRWKLGTLNLLSKKVYRWKLILLISWRFALLFLTFLINLCTKVTFVRKKFKVLRRKCKAKSLLCLRKCIGMVMITFFYNSYRCASIDSLKRKKARNPPKRAERANSDKRGKFSEWDWEIGDWFGCNQSDRNIFLACQNQLRSAPLNLGG